MDATAYPNYNKSSVVLPVSTVRVPICVYQSGEGDRWHCEVRADQDWSGENTGFGSGSTEDEAIVWISSDRP